MAKSRIVATVLTASLLALGALAAQSLSAQSQDEMSPGDVARLARLKKQQRDAQAKSAPPVPKPAPSGDASMNPQEEETPAQDGTARNVQPAKAHHVITNDDIPEHGPTRAANPGSPPPGSYRPPIYGEGRTPAEYWRAQIQQLKDYIASMESNLKDLTESIQHSGGNCISNCVLRNLQQRQRQQQLEAIKAQLAAEEKQLQRLQEGARRQGYGSSVYDP